MIKSFLLGLLTGATAAWVLKDSIVTQIDAQTRALRATTAHRLRTAADSIERGVAGESPADTPTRIGRVS